MIGKLFSELLGDGKRLIEEARHGTATRTLTVAKAYCTPARNIITGALQPYGVKIYGYREYAQYTSPRAWLRQHGIDDGEDVRIPMAQFADVTVSEEAAAWAEYLLLRTGRLYVPGDYVNRRNQEWADRHGGRMPPQWDKGEPLIEKGCIAGVNVWRNVKQQQRRGRRENKKNSDKRS